MKRNEYLTWDEYFMGIAVLSSLRSKDPSTQVGACIVDSNHRILSVGYNGMPFSGRSDNDKEYSWDKADGLDSKYLYVCHAELNAILNSGGHNLNGCRIFVALFPCNECAKAIIQAGIKTIVYDCDKYANTPAVIASKRMLDAAGVRYYKYNRTGRKITIEV